MIITDVFPKKIALGDSEPHQNQLWSNEDLRSQTNKHDIFLNNYCY